jgi:hypothetical protein
VSIIRYKARLLQSSQNLVLPVGHQYHEDLKSVDHINFYENILLVDCILRCSQIKFCLFSKKSGVTLEVKSVINSEDRTVKTMKAIVCMTL